MSDPESMPPIPVQSLGYSAPMPMRPGIITAIGIISIIIGCFSVLGNLYTGMIGVAFYAFSNIKMTTPATPPPPTIVTGIPTTSTSSQDTIAADGDNSSEGDSADDSVADDTASGATRLSAAELQAVLNQAQSASQNKLNPAQLAALQNVLSAAGQTYATPGVKAPAVMSAFVQPNNGMASIYFFNGTITIDRTGRVVSQFSSTTGPGGFTASNPMAGVSGVASMMVIADALISFGLAILLFVSGILMLRQSSLGRTLHLIYAWIKIPLAIGGAISLLWLVSGMISNLPGVSGAGAGRGYIVGGIVMAAVGCAYPIALLIALNTRAVRDYYNSAAYGLM